MLASPPVSIVEAAIPTEHCLRSYHGWARVTDPTHERFTSALHDLIETVHTHCRIPPPSSYEAIYIQALNKKHTVGQISDMDTPKASIFEKGCVPTADGSTTGRPRIIDQEEKPCLASSSCARPTYSTQQPKRHRFLLPIHHAFY